MRGLGGWKCSSACRVHQGWREEWGAMEERKVTPPCLKNMGWIWDAGVGWWATRQGLHDAGIVYAALKVTLISLAKMNCKMARTLTASWKGLSSNGNLCCCILLSQSYSILQSDSPG